MTTEAVVINRIGVALATDSAVTITGPNKNKVFDTGDKLFELDLAHPEQATVGGPVDVAFISRHEGFVWIKRKHYFNKDLNPRYFKRRFQPPDGGEQA